MIIVDTNVLVYATIPGKWTEAALAAAERDPDWAAPPLWRFELRNVLATAMRTQGMKLALALAAFEAAEGLVIDTDLQPAVEEILKLAARGKISAYDAEFVYAAEQLDLPLVTADRRLAKAFPGRAISLGDL